jgi:hypothetical protein
LFQITKKYLGGKFPPAVFQNGIMFEKSAFQKCDIIFLGLFCVSFEILIRDICGE